MSLSVSFPTEIEAALRQRAAAAGKDVETFVREIFIEEVADEPLPKTDTQSHGEFKAKLQAIIDLHAVSNGKMDDSRESIYSGRGE